MAILNLFPFGIGAVGVRPSIWLLTSNDSLSAVTTAGYVSNEITTGVSIANGDFFLCNYGTSANTPVLLVATIVAATGVITLNAPFNGFVTLPVVDGDFATFNGTTGNIEDAGYSPSNPTKTKVVMANGATVVNNVALFADTAGTIYNGGTIITGSTNAYGGGGTSFTFTAANVLAVDGTSLVCAIASQTNNASLRDYVAANGQILARFTADPGALTSLNYIAFRAP